MVQWLIKSQFVPVHINLKQIKAEQESESEPVPPT